MALWTDDDDAASEYSYDNDVVWEDDDVTDTMSIIGNEGGDVDGESTFEDGGPINLKNAADWLKRLVGPQKVKVAMVTRLKDVIGYADVEKEITLRSPYDAALLLFLEDMDYDDQKFRGKKKHDPLLKELLAAAQKKQPVFSSQEVMQIAVDSWASWSANEENDLWDSGAERTSQEDQNARKARLGNDLSKIWDQWYWDLPPANLECIELDAWDSFFQFLAPLNRKKGENGRFPIPEDGKCAVSSCVIRPLQQRMYFCEKHRLCQKIERRTVCGFSCLPSRFYCKQHNCECTGCKQCESENAVCSRAKSTNTKFCTSCNGERICSAQGCIKIRKKQSPYCVDHIKSRSTPGKKKRKLNAHSPTLYIEEEDDEVEFLFSCSSTQ